MVMLCGRVCSVLVALLFILSVVIERLSYFTCQLTCPCLRADALRCALWDRSYGGHFDRQRREDVPGPCRVG
jgi:hypothetical protein